VSEAVVLMAGSAAKPQHPPVPTRNPRTSHAGWQDFPDTFRRLGRWGRGPSG